MTSPSGYSVGHAPSIVFDASGAAIQPKHAYISYERWERAFRREWGSIDEMAASLKEMAPPAEGLPDGAPSGNTVFRDERGTYFRYIVDPEFKREPFVSGSDEVRERVQFKRQNVALSLTDAQERTDKRRPDEPETDFWCGYTWIRGGYSPERTAPVVAQIDAIANGGAPLVFDQPASPSDVARLRHEVSRLDRTTPTLPVEAPPVKRGRKATTTDNTTGGEIPPVED